MRAAFVEGGNVATHSVIFISLPKEDAIAIASLKLALPSVLLELRKDEPKELPKELPPRFEDPVPSASLPRAMGIGAGIVIVMRWKMCVLVQCVNVV